MLYTENPKDFTQKLQDLMNEFIKEAGTRLTFRNLFHSFSMTMKYQNENVLKKILFKITFKNT